MDLESSHPGPLPAPAAGVSFLSGSVGCNNSSSDAVDGIDAINSGTLEIPSTPLCDEVLLGTSHEISELDSEAIIELCTEVHTKWIEFGKIAANNTIAYKLFGLNILDQYDIDKIFAIKRNYNWIFENRKAVSVEEKERTYRH